MSIEPFAALGLRTNDIPLTINGLPLDDYYDVAAAFADLYLQGETEYTLVVKRGAANITLLYELDP